MSQPKFELPVPAVKYCILSFPQPNILLVELNRAKELNCVNLEGHAELDALWTWLDEEPSLVCGIITGKGRSFCAGADLKEWNSHNQGGKKRVLPASGFCGLSRRNGRKPVIAAVNGICYGGGFEAAVNCDLLVASPKATFSLPEVKIGVVALAGALPRLIRTVGKPRAMEMALTGRAITAAEGFEWGLVNKVVGNGEDEVVKVAIDYAKMIAANSPDAVIITREGVKMGWEGVGAEDATRQTADTWAARLHGGANHKEGVQSFVEKRKPRWTPARL